MTELIELESLSFISFTANLYSRMQKRIAKKLRSKVSIMNLKVA
jgi:hypothetical protein